MSYNIDILQEFYVRKGFIMDNDYYNWLENYVRNQKKNSLFHMAGTNEHYYDVMNLVHHIEKTNPFIFHKIAKNYIDITNFDIPKSFDIKEYVSGLEKGTIVKYKDKEGHSLFYINRGENFVNGNKKILIISDLLETSDVKFLKKTIIGKILEKDINKVYQKLHKEQALSQSSKKTFFGTNKSHEQSKSEQNDYIIDGFERKFKKMVKEVGNPLADAGIIGKVMFKSMTEGERKNINKAFSSFSPEAFLSLLNKWKYEALNPKQEHSVKSITRSVSDDGLGR